MNSVDEQLDIWNHPPSGLERITTGIRSTPTVVKNISLTYTYLPRYRDYCADNGIPVRIRDLYNIMRNGQLESHPFAEHIKQEDKREHERLKSHPVWGKFMKDRDT